MFKRIFNFMSKPRRNKLVLQLFNDGEEGSEVIDQQPNQGDGVENEEFDVIDYNKEEIKIPVSERKTYLQKGYNYDKVETERTSLKAENEALKGSKELSYIKNFLKANGYENIEAYEDYLATEEVMKEGFSQEQASSVLKGRKAEAAEAKTMESATAEKSRVEKETTMIHAFVEKFPDVDIEKLSDSVVSMYKSGIDLSIAYELDQLRSGTDRTKIEQETLKQLEQNKQISSGSAKGGQSNHQSSISKMSNKDFQKMKEGVLRGEINHL